MNHPPRASKYFVWLALVAPLVLPAGVRADHPPLPSPAVPGRFALELQAGGYDRVAEIHIPSGYTTDSRPPLVLLFHGAGGNGNSMLDKDHWAAKADAEGFIAVAPEGLPAKPSEAPAFFRNPQLWNAGQLRADSPRAAVDDVAYVAKLLDELKTKIPYDERRLFSAGHSNGGGMTFRLAAESANWFAAIGVVSGMMAVANPRPARPVPTLFIVGTQDPLMPIAGGEVKLPWGKKQNPPVADFLAAWAKAIGCQTQPKLVSDAGGLQKLQYPSKAGGPTLSVIYIAGHGHHWPGGEEVLPPSMIGPVKKNLDATDTVWDFFKSTGGAAK